MNHAEYLQAIEDFDNTNKVAFAKMVREGRQLAGSSLRQVATAVRTAPGTVSRWENEYCAPPVIARREILRNILAVK